MLDYVLDALLDSVKVLGVVLVVYILLSFFEEKIAHAFEKKSHFSPLLGAVLGVVPQCGLSVVSADLYLKEHITMGTLMAIFIACSDEALPIMLSSKEYAIRVLPLLGIKIVVGFVVGYIVDLIFRKDKKEVRHHTEECHHEEEIHIGCCNHEIDNHEESKLHKHLIHPLIHSLKIFLYIFVINLIFAFIFYFVGEDSIMLFLEKNRYLAPLYATIVGIIPNCASSVIITKLYIMGDLSFGATLAGLIMNAGLGMMVLLKDKKHWKKALLIFGMMAFVSLLFGYLYCIIFGF